MIKREKCFQFASENLLKGKSVAVGECFATFVPLLTPPLTAIRADNTNADPETRAKWVQLAGKHGVPIRCLYFTATADLCRHNSVVRALGGEIVSSSALRGGRNLAILGLERGESRPPRSIPADREGTVDEP